MDQKKALTINPRVTSTLLTCLIAGSGLTACGDASEPAPPQPRGVLFERVASTASVISSVFSGVTQAHVDARMSFKVPGTVLERPINVGDAVQSGALLAQLDRRDYTSAVQAAEAEHRAAQAQARQADANYERLISLYENRNTSLSELEAARAAAESADASVLAAGENLRQAQLQLSYTRLAAPEQCEIAETFVKVGENVDAGTPIARLTCGNCPEVRVNIPQTRIGLIESGMTIDVAVAGRADERYPARVSEVGVASGSGATFPVTAIFSGDCPDLRSGIAADVHFAFDTGAPPEVTVPSVAVGEDDTGRYVFVLEPQADDLYIARRRGVEVGNLTQAARFVVSDGLNEGELIATAGVRRIQDGQTVRLANGLRS